MTYRDHKKWFEVVKLAREMLIRYEYQLRVGQALFNAMVAYDPVTANKIRGTEDDCFFSNKLCLKFTKKVLEYWREDHHV